MVAHEAFGRSRLAHVAHNLQRFQNLRTPVDIVAEKDDHAVGVSPHAAAFFISQAGKQGLQLVCAAVYITYHVVTIQHTLLQMAAGRAGNP